MRFTVHAHRPGTIEWRPVRDLCSLPRGAAVMLANDHLASKATDAVRVISEGGQVAYSAGKPDSVLHSEAVERMHADRAERYARQIRIHGRVIRP